MKIHRRLVEDMFAHAREAAPMECCGVIGGSERSAHKVYRLRNRASNPLSAYDADPEDLFAAQKQMRAGGETLVAIYHSHPRARVPLPSETDVRLAYYPAAIYFILGGVENEQALGAFRLFENGKRWEFADYVIVETDD